MALYEEAMNIRAEGTLNYVAERRAKQYVVRGDCRSSIVDKF